jgi:ribosomal protein S18 acetylase RimI-like enzyme
MVDQTHHPALLEMMRSLYREDPASAAVPDSHFQATLATLLIQPQSGRVVLFLDEAKTLHGYAILIPYWSNEFGGVIVFVDELYVRMESRNRGIARGLFTFVADARPFDAKIIALEVSPDNVKARRLYESLGFETRRYTMMTMPIQ